MPEFTVSRAYSGYKRIECEDLLEAVRYVFNIDGDLFYRGEVLVSCLQYNQDVNIKNLEKVGILMYFPNNSVAFKWIDEEKNSQKYYANFIDLERLEMKAGLEVHVNDFRSIKSEILFEDLKEIRKYAEKEYPYKGEQISILYFSRENEIKRL